MTTAAVASSTGNASVLRNLYFVRFGFAIVWAALLFVVGSGVGPLSVTLIVLYPLFDVAAAIVDSRSSGPSGSTRLLYVNIAISSLTAIGLVFALTSGIPAVLRVWGAWAVVAGHRPAHRGPHPPQAGRPVGDDRQWGHLRARGHLVLPAGRR